MTKDEMKLWRKVYLAEIQRGSIADSAWAERVAGLAVEGLRQAVTKFKTAGVNFSQPIQTRGSGVGVFRKPPSEKLGTI